MYRIHQESPQGGDHAHGELVAAIARFLKPTFYVELGCNSGDTFEKVEPYCSRAVAVDIKEDRFDHLQARGLGDHFVCKDSLDYIATLDDETVELCFIDSSHQEEMTFREFSAIAPKMTKNGIILMHDSYPPNQDYEQSDKCGGVSRAVERIRKNNAMFEFVTMPCQFGLTIARKSYGKQVLWR
jgi:predicted O-methyltransferase YrrM